MQEITFAEWFDNLHADEDPDKFNRFKSYSKIFDLPADFGNLTAKDVVKHAHEFYDIWAVDYADREKAFEFASDILNIPYYILYEAWLTKRPINDNYISNIDISDDIEIESLNERVRTDVTNDEVKPGNIFWDNNEDHIKVKVLDVYPDGTVEFVDIFSDYVHHRKKDLDSFLDYLNMDDYKLWEIDNNYITDDSIADVEIESLAESIKREDIRAGNRFSNLRDGYVDYEIESVDENNDLVHIIRMAGYPDYVQQEYPINNFIKLLNMDGYSLDNLAMKDLKPGNIYWNGDDDYNKIELISLDTNSKVRYKYLIFTDPDNDYSECVDTIDDFLDMLNRHNYIIWDSGEDIEIESLNEEYKVSEIDNSYYIVNDDYEIIGDEAGYTTEEAATEAINNILKNKLNSILDKETDKVEASKIKENEYIEIE